MSLLQSFEFAENILARLNTTDGAAGHAANARMIAETVQPLIDARARLDAITAILAPAWEAGERAPGPGWASDGAGFVYDSLEATHALASCVSDDIAHAITTAVNAVRALRTVMEAQP